MFYSARLIALGVAAVLAAQGQRMFVTQSHAWDNPATLMAAGKVVSARYPQRTNGEPSPDRNAYYDLEISEWLKPRAGGQPSRITIAAEWGVTDTAFFQVGSEVLVFVQKSGEYYHSLREIQLDTPEGRQALMGSRLFVGILYLPGIAERRKACLVAWNENLSDPEKQSVLDAMWETRTPEYSGILRKVALGNHSPRVRGWALTVLASIGNGEGTEELVPILLSDAACEVKRQLLIVLGEYRVHDALAAIDKFLTTDQAARCPSGSAENLRSYARQAHQKITGEDARPGWR